MSVDMEEARRQLRAVLRESGLDPEDFCVEDLDKLWRGGYRKRQHLDTATPEDLRSLGLTPARVGSILAIKREDAGIRVRLGLGWIRLLGKEFLGRIIYSSCPAKSMQEPSRC